MLRLTGSNCEIPHGFTIKKFQKLEGKVAVFLEKGQYNVK